MNREEDITKKNQAAEDEHSAEESAAETNEEAAREEEQPVPDLQEKLTEAEKQAASYKDLYLRKAAELDNYKRRMENETGLIVRFANEELLQTILPVVDDLERSLKSASELKQDALFKGVELIHQKIVKVLQAQGVTPFETVGKPFDVHYHDALLQVPKKGIPPHTILEEVEKGYMYHDKVLRHAKVIVSAEDESGENVNASEEAGDREKESDETG